MTTLKYILKNDKNKKFPTGYNVKIKQPTINKNK